MLVVSISRQAKIDLDNIVIGLLDWDKIVLTVDEVKQYVDDIVEIAYSLEKINVRFKATYNDHLKYGEFAHTYKRNNSTVWYIIYDIDENGNIFINKIISNYMTVS